MKIALATISFFMVLFFFSAVKPVEAACLRMQGTIGGSSSNFPAGGKVIIKCDGDAVPGASSCTGNSAALAPGQTYDFPSCSCLGAGKCIEVVSVPTGCTYTLTGQMCGTNGNTIYPDINVTCPAPATPCPKGAGYCAGPDGKGATSCPGGEADPDSWLDTQGYKDWCNANAGGSKSYCFNACKPAATATATTTPSATSAPPTATTVPGVPTATTPPGVPTVPPVPTATTPPGVPTATKAPSATPKAPTPTTKVPACGDTCSSKAECDGAKDGCVECLPDATGKKVCSKPPACGTACSSKATCDGAKDGCVECLPDATGKKVCSKPPACGTPCSSKATCEGAKDGCVECIPDATGKKVCAETPFNEEMCKCDSLKYGAILLGQPLAVTAFGKVSGDDVKYAKIPSFTFKFFESDGGTKVTEITSKTTKVPTTIISTSPTLVRYQADWVLDLDENLDTDKTYRIQAKPECSKKIALYQPATVAQTRSVVLAAQDKKVSLWDRIVGFFAGVFGTGGGTQNIAGRVPTPTLTAEQKARLQIGTIKPATFVEELPDPESKQNCTFVRFKF